MVSVSEVVMANRFGWSGLSSRLVNRVQHTHLRILSIMTSCVVFDITKVLERCDQGTVSKTQLINNINEYLQVIFFE